MAGRLLGSWTPCKQSPALLQIIDSEGSQNNILPIYIYTTTVAREQNGSGEGEALTGASDATSPLVHWEALLLSGFQLMGIYKSYG